MDKTATLIRMYDREIKWDAVGTRGIYASISSYYRKRGIPFVLSEHRNALRAARDFQFERVEFAKYATTLDRCVCERCGGAGGHSSWPGWTCFDCGGKGMI